MESEIICYCSNVTKQEILTAMENGAKSLDDIRKATGACTIAKCKDLSPKKKCCSRDIMNILELN